MENKFKIKPFDFNQFTHPSCIFTYIRGHDATCWFLQILNTLTIYKNIHKVAIVHGKYNENTYLHVTKDQFIYSQYEPKLVSNIEARHQLICQNNAKYNTQIDSSLLLFLDRCFYKLENEKSLNKLFASQKTNNLSICWSMLPGINFKKLIPYTDFAIIGDISSLAEQKRIYKLFASFIPDFQVFYNLLLEVTRYHIFIVINLKSSSTQIHEKIFYLNLKQYPL